MIRVVNVTGLRTPKQRYGIVYVGRKFAGWPAHPLANPFRIRRPASGACQNAMEKADRIAREGCLEKYHTWLLARPTLEEDLVLLWEETRCGQLPLGCWCVPKLCHATVLAEMLTERFP